tara:strand:- start:270 stop:1694 length:1425 start_codon:yes stop_codon:yes gene_type:complete
LIKPFFYFCQVRQIKSPTKYCLIVDNFISRGNFSSEKVNELRSRQKLQSYNQLAKTESTSVDNINFAELGLPIPLIKTLISEKYEHPTPIQACAIPIILRGHDLLGIAQTGTGKTAAFSLPILNLLSEIEKRPMPRSTRALILAPTRELVIQIGEAMKVYGRELPLRYSIIYGGVGQMPQVAAMRRGVDVLVATPGRLLDLVEQKYIRLDHVTHFILDEADRMLDMGFIHDVRKIVSQLPVARQTLLFSATMPQPVVHLAKKVLHNPKKVSVAPTATPVETVDQQVLFTSKDKKRSTLQSLLQDPSFRRVIVFTRTKHKAARVAEQLTKANISSDAMHGDKSQSARQKTLQDFRSGRIKVLVATDIAARGIDVDDVTHVINYELPSVPEDYIHRIGRTARAGAAGLAISLCDPEEQSYLQDIEHLTKIKLSIIDGKPKIANRENTTIARTKTKKRKKRTRIRKEKTSSTRNRVM